MSSSQIFKLYQLVYKSRKHLLEMLEDRGFNVSDLKNYTEEEIKNMSEENFANLISEVERRLPKKSDIKKIPEQALHHTPPLIIEAGRNLGLIKEVLNEHQTYEKKALDFYEKCASTEETPTTVRAICLTNLVVINNKNGKKISTNKYPKEIVDLSKIVTDL